MNPQQQRIALATWQGWTKIDAVPSRPWGFPPEGQPYIFSPLPDYLSDLNAVHELEERLTVSDKIEYVIQLSHVVPDKSFAEGLFTYRLIHATAAQRCDALLITLGLWKD